jgi:AcrR family transcriptional regulator
VTAQRRRLNRDRVLEAALSLADREGAEALTVRRLADVLGVHPTSLYNHLPHKAAILDGVVERLFDEADLPAEVVSWQEWVRAIAVAFRDLARAHPGAFMVLTRRPVENAAAFRLTEIGLDAFCRAGFSLLDAVHAVRGVSLTVLGLALNECPPMGDWVEPVPADVAQLAGFPRLVEAAALVEEDDDAHWQTVVEALVAGLERPLNRA